MADPPSRLHYVNVGQGGTFAASGADQTLPAHVNEILARIRDDGVEKVLVFFHGGLVDEASGLALASRLEREYEGWGVYGITIVWETGVDETIKNLAAINKTKLFNKLVNYAIRHAAKWLGAEVGAKGPGQLMDLDDVQAARESDAEMEKMDIRAKGGGAAPATPEDVDDIAGEIELDIQADFEGDIELAELLSQEGAETEALDQSVRAETRTPEGQKGISLAAVKIATRIVVRTLKRFADNRDHGVIPTVVEEVLREAYLDKLGFVLWGGMKMAAADMWEPDDGPVSVDSHAGTYLLAGLARLQADKDITVDVVGHSAGAIAAAHMLDAAADRHPDLELRHVVLLAPAASAEVFDSYVRHQDRYNTLRMFTMTDDNECKDHIVKGVYPRSLLYFISGVLDGSADAPVVGLRRHTSGEKPYDGDPLGAIHRFLDEPGMERTVLSETAVGAAAGFASASLKHGNFDNDRQTLDSIGTIVAEA